MTGNAVTNHGEPNKFNRRVAHGVLCQDLIEAVEVVSAHMDVPGSAAYRILLQAAEDLRVSTRDLAESIVRAPQSSDVLRLIEERSRWAPADDANGQGPG